MNATQTKHLILQGMPRGTCNMGKHCNAGNKVYPPEHPTDWIFSNTHAADENGKTVTAYGNW